MKWIDFHKIKKVGTEGIKHLATNNKKGKKRSKWRFFPVVSNCKREVTYFVLNSFI